MLGGKARAGVLAGVMMLACAVPSSASGAVTIGETFTPPGGCVGPITFVQSDSPQSAYSVPSAGVLTSWSYQASTAVSPIKLKVATQVGANSFRIEAESALETPVASTLNTYPLRASVEPGSVIGIYVAGVAGCTRFLPASGFEEHYLASDSVPGQTQSYILDECCYQLDVAAELEPDADRDGFGDETQDECPTDASEHEPLRPARDRDHQGPIQQDREAEGQVQVHLLRARLELRVQAQGQGTEEVGQAVRRLRLAAQVQAPRRGEVQVRGPGHRCRRQRRLDPGQGQVQGRRLTGPTEATWHR